MKTYVRVIFYSLFHADSRYSHVLHVSPFIFNTTSAPMVISDTVSVLKVQLWFMERVLIPGWRGERESRMVTNLCFFKKYICPSLAITRNTTRLTSRSFSSLPFFLLPFVLCQSRRTKMDREAEPCVASSAEKRGDEQDTNPRRYGAPRVEKKPEKILRAWPGLWAQSCVRDGCQVEMRLKYWCTLTKGKRCRF